MSARRARRAGLGSALALAVFVAGGCSAPSMGRVRMTLPELDRLELLAEHVELLDTLPDLDGDGLREALLLGGERGARTLEIRTHDGRRLLEQRLDPTWGEPTASAVQHLPEGDRLWLGFADGSQGGLRAGLLASMVLPLGSLESQRRGSRIGDRYGRELVSVGDLNGDGAEELLVGADQSRPIGDSRSGYAELLDGRSRQPLRRFSNVGSVAFGSCLAGLGDLDSDGVYDLLVGGRRQAYALYSGRGGESIEGTFDLDEATLGVHVLDDMDGDGIDDLVVERLDELVLVSGANGKRLLRFHPPAEVLNRSSRFPGSVSRNAGDFDGDGRDDWATGDFGHARLLPDGGPRLWNELAGRLTIYSGATGRAILIVEGLRPGEQLGRTIEAAGDVDGDGCDDLYVGTRGQLYLCHGRRTPRRP